MSETSEEREGLIANGNKKNISNRSLIQKIETILASYELQEKYSTKLTQQTLTVIEQLIKTKPEFFRMVESNVLRNINNNEIQSSDIPYIISIISHLYNLLITMNIESQYNSESIVDTCNNILKFMFSVVIREQIVKVDSDTDSTLLMLCFDNIVDACIKLLKLKTQRHMPQPSPVRVKEIVDVIPKPEINIAPKAAQTPEIPYKQQDRCC